MINVDNYLEEHAKKVEVLAYTGISRTGKLLNDRLVLVIDQSLYVLDYVEEFTGTFPSPFHVVIDECGYKIINIINNNLDGRAFEAELTKLPAIHTDWYKMFIDGEQVYKTISSRKCSKMRDTYLRERKDSNINFNHLKVVDPAGNATDFLFNQNDPGVLGARKLAKAKQPDV